MIKTKLVRAAERTGDAIEWIKKRWKLLVSIAAGLAAIVLLATLYPTCDKYDSDVTQQQILDEMAREREETDRKIEALQAELFEYREQLRVIDDEIRDSIRERERAHDKIDDATTIGGIDRALRSKRIGPKRATRTRRLELKRPSEAPHAARRLDPNPYD